MSKRILWLENDPIQLEPYIEFIEEEGYEVTIVKSPTQAEDAIKAGRYDLVILDVMVPTLNAEEEMLYPPALTEHGHKTGLLFYRRMKGELNRSGTSVFVMTVRLDQNIRDEFIKAGLSREHFATKFVMRDVSTFLTKIKSLTGESL